jgi:DNA-directed RNA polymerase I, II, and III subunit RPABC5
MLLPVRCFTCGKPLSHLWFPYTQHLTDGCGRGDILTHLGLKRYCCRRMLLTHVELSETFISIQQRVETRD